MMVTLKQINFRSDPPAPPANYKEVLEILTGTCPAAGYPVYLLQVMTSGTLQNTEYTMTFTCSKEISARWK